jgi:hypothetical protein
MNNDLQTAIRMLAICVIAVLCTIGLLLTLFFKNYSDPTTLVAITTTLSICIGALSGRRSIEQQQPVNESRKEPPNTESNREANAWQGTGNL